MDYTIVTSIPIFNYKGHIYLDDTWNADINAQSGIWQKIRIICPERSIDNYKKLVSPNNDISFLTFTNFLEFISIIFEQLKSHPKNEMIFEFAGTSPNGVLGFLIAKLFFWKKVPLFITFDAPLSMILLPYKNISLKKLIVVIYIQIMKLFRKFTAFSADGVIVVGKGIIEEFYNGDNYDKFLVLPLTLFEKTDIFYHDKSASNTLKIACMDRMEPEKGVFDLVIAFEKIGSKMPQSNLHIFGSGSQEKMIKEYCLDKKIDSRVTFHGIVSHADLMEELKTVDILINITKVGDINRTMWEGASKGCAIIASDLEGVKTFFTNKANALLINPNNVDDLANNLLTLYEDKNLRTTLSKNAIRLAEQYTNKKVKLLRKKWILSKINQYP